jgi:hypothetical protein
LPISSVQLVSAEVILSSKHPLEINNKMKAFNIVFIVLFIISAALQYNDPDWYLWIPIYLYGALICYQAVKKKLDPVLYFIGFLVYGAYALYLFFDKTGVLSWVVQHNAENIVQSMKATKPWIEETREFGGLFILIVVLLVDFVWLKKREKTKKDNT